jgi:hypothetical protein
VLPVIHRNGKAVLQGGRLLGASVGDQYRIMPPGHEKSDPEGSVALAMVTNVTAAVAEIRPDFEEGYTAIPEGANAFPEKRALPKLPVRVTASGEEGGALRQAIEGSKFVRVAADDDPAEILAEVVVTDGEIDLRFTDGPSMIESKSYSEAAVHTTALNLERFARRQALVNLPGGEGPNALQVPYEIEWGRVVDGERRPLNPSGELLFVGDAVYMRVVNKGSATIYCSIFDVGVSAKITLLTASGASGIVLQPDQDYVFGRDDIRGLTGVNLGWASGVPQDEPREESLVAIVSDKPQDLRALEQSAMRGFKDRGATTPLEDMLEQIGSGGTRDLTPQRGAHDVRYAVERISFLLDPSPATRIPVVQDKGAFLIDERPPLSMVRMPAARGVVPSNIALRLTDLIVHSNRALFSTEIRLDALVLTGPSDGDSDGIYLMDTARFTGIKDEDRLPFDNLLIYHGPAVNFVDMAIWVSRNQKDSLSLAELFKTELNSAEFKTAAIALAGLAVAAPQAAVIAGAVAAGATMANIGTKLLLQAVGNSIGLYRTSFLKQEGYGVGRKPVQGVMRAQDFSFAYEVIAVD